MQHHDARSIIGHFGAACDLRLLAAVALAQLHERGMLSASLWETGLNAFRALPMHEAPVSSLDPGAIARDEQGLVDQLAPIVTDHPARCGLQVARLWALKRLWPHATVEERGGLRQAWLNAVTSQKASSESQLTRSMLRSWQRSLPTWANAEALSTADLEDLLDRPTARDAHFALASYLGLGTDLSTLANILGTFAGRLLLTRFDDQLVLVEHLVGCAMFPRLAQQASPAPMSVIVSQLAHALWWCGKDPACRPLQPGSEQDLSLAEAIKRGDMTAASRAARLALRRGEDCWPLFASFLEQLCADGHRRACHAVLAMAAVRSRQGDAPLPAPDLLAALAASFAAMFHLAARGSQPFQRHG